MMANRRNDAKLNSVALRQLLDLQIRINTELFEQLVCARFFPAFIEISDEPQKLPCCKGEIKLWILRRSEEHTSELQSLTNLVCRLLLEKKKQKIQYRNLIERPELQLHSIQF